MNPIKLFRKFIKLVRGGAAPWQIIASCLLGVIIGMIPGFNALVLVALVVFAITNLSLGLMLIGLLVGKALCYALAPVTFEIGYVIIHDIGLEGLFATLCQTPFVALMGLHYYCLIGGLPIALIVGGAMGWTLAGAIKKLRVGVIAAGDKSEKVQKLAAKGSVRFLMRILFGKQKKTLAEMLELKHPVIRKSGVVLLGIIVGLVVVFEVMFVDKIARSATIGGLELYQGAEVNAETVSMSLAGGEFAVSGLQLTDPEKPTHNAPQISKITADLSISGLLSGRAVVDELVVGTLERDAKRASPGKVYREPERPEAPNSESALSDYFENPEEILEHLQTAWDFLKEHSDKKDYILKRKSGTDTEAAREEARRLAKEMAAVRGYFAASASSILAPKPSVTIRHLLVEDIPMPDLGKCTLEAHEVSTNLALNEKPMTIDFRGPDKLGISATLDFVTPESKHKLSIKNLVLGKAIRLSDRCPLDVNSAKVDIEAAGTFTPEDANIAVVLTVHDLKSTPRDGRGVLGLDAATSGKIFKKIDSVSVYLTIRGSLRNPEVQVDTAKTLAGLQAALKQAGMRVLADQAGAQLDKIAPGFSEKLGGVTSATQPADVLEGVGKGALDLLKDKDKDKDKEPTSKPDGPKDPTGGLLDKIGF
ncbi:MAG: hypothetical protein GY794_19355 [bacterium]|nr:hypothetical protein [bacterium]